MALDSIDVNAPNAARAALLQRVMSQSSVNQSATKSYDQLNASNARLNHLPQPMGMANSLAMGPTPAPGPQKTPIYPGSPVTGTASFLSLPAALQQLFIKNIAQPSTSTLATSAVTDDQTRALQAAMNQGV